jgi:pimeloyl-ACP methyl ester carboxylesterase
MGYWSHLNLGKDFFSRIQCPILMMTGDEDDHAPIQTVVDAYYMAPKAQLSIIPKAWHTCFLDNFPATWWSLKQFVLQDIGKLQGSRKVYL